MDLKYRLRSLFSSFKAGMAIESNWTSWHVFFIYSFIRPLGAILILLFMWVSAESLGATVTIFQINRMLIGGLFLMIFSEIVHGMRRSIYEDKNWYQVINLIYLSPIGLTTHLFGRGLAKLAVSSVSLIVVYLSTFVVILSFKFNINIVGQINFIFLFSAFIPIGFSLLTFGILMANINLILIKGTPGLGEIIITLFSIFSGILFPISILPSILQPISYFVPMTYWSEATRRALGIEISSEFSNLNNFSLIIVNWLIFFILFGIVLFTIKKIDKLIREEDNLKDKS